MGDVFDQSEILSQISTEVEQRFSQLDDLAHGWDHINRVYKLAMYIAEQEKADSFIVGAAALLHDLGHAPSPGEALNNGSGQEEQEEQEHHADRSVALADKLLQTYQLPPDVQQAILHAIVAHSFSRGVEPQTLEARVVRDADRLDALGAIGIMRWAITGEQRHSARTKAYHLDDPLAERRSPNDHDFLLDHFFTKLLSLGEAMATETGRFLAVRRLGFMRTYLYEFKRELELS